MYYGKNFLDDSGAANVGCVAGSFLVVDSEKFALISDSITINGQNAVYKEKNGEIYFEIKDIAASDLDTDYTLTIGTNSYKYSVMNYVKAALLSDRVDSKLKSLANALYWYNQAANTYFGR